MRRRRGGLPEGGFIGIDPGRSSGAIAYVVGTYAFAWPLKEMTDRDIWRRVQGLAEVARYGVLEHVWAVGSGTKKPSAGSSFKFGASYGELKMALIACGVQFDLVVPTKWQRAVLRRTTKGDKSISREQAERRWPGLRITNQTADSLWLAEYARRTVG